MGIEPTQPAWKAGILPLNYTRILLVTRTRIELVLQPWKGRVLTSWPTGRIYYGGGNWIRTSDTAGMNRVL